jgi:NAD(P)-dependent dehydrogenase (short-subunit alcohol dehydrogenase family)
MRRSIITGCEGQLGRVFVSKLKELGYSVIGVDRCPCSDNPDVEYFQLDITKKSLVETFIKSLNGPIDVLINNAGVSVFSPFEERSEEELDYVIGVNIKGPLHMTQSVFNYKFKPQMTGCIVNIGSIYGVVAGDMRIYREDDRRTPEIYGASKAAVINLTKYFSCYMAPYNVRVNCISPGGIFNNQDKHFVEMYSSKVPMKRMGFEHELQSTLEYLISEKSSYLTGQNIIVDGGLTAW